MNTSETNNRGYVPDEQRIALAKAWQAVPQTLKTNRQAEGAFKTGFRLGWHAREEEGVARDVRSINGVAEIRRRVGQLAETVVTGGPSEICAALDNLEESVTAMRVAIERARVDKQEPLQL